MKKHMVFYGEGNLHVISHFTRVIYSFPLNIFKDMHNGSYSNESCELIASMFSL